MPMTPRDHKWYGWRRQLPDFRDRRFAIPPRFQLESELPPAVDLEPLLPPVMDQGALGSCVSQGVTAAMRADRKSQGLPDIALSRLQLYYDGRVAEGTVNEDCGLEIRTGIKVANQGGVAPELDWPYVVSRWKARPPAEVYAKAPANEALEYEAVDITVHAVKAALASGHVVVIGVAIYTSFEARAVDRTGVVPMPDPARERQIGGHCMVLHGYDDAKDPSVAHGRNSWGADWGQRGNFTIPWRYVTDRGLADDFWIVKTVGPAPAPAA